MAFYVARNFVLFLNIICFHNFLGSAQEMTEKYAESKFFHKSSKVNDPKDIPNEANIDSMFMDASEGTTPAVCSPGGTCGFQQYEQDIVEYRYSPFLTYCHCPEDQGCVESGQNMKSRFFYYTCQNVTVTEDSNVEATETAGITYSSEDSNVEATETAGITYSSEDSNVEATETAGISYSSDTASTANSDNASMTEFETEPPMLRNRVGPVPDPREL